MFLKKTFFQKEKGKIMLHLELKFLSTLCRLSDFTVGIGTDVYCPFVAGEEKWVCNRKEYLVLC